MPNEEKSNYAVLVRAAVEYAYKRRLHSGDVPQETKTKGPPYWAALLLFGAVALLGAVAVLAAREVSERANWTVAVIAVVMPASLLVVGIFAFTMKWLEGYIWHVRDNVNLQHYFARVREALGMNMYDEWPEARTATMYRLQELGIPVGRIERVLQLIAVSRVESFQLVGRTAEESRAVLNAVRRCLGEAHENERANLIHTYHTLLDCGWVPSKDRFVQDWGNVPEPAPVENFIPLIHTPLEEEVGARREET